MLQRSAFRWSSSHAPPPRRRLPPGPSLAEFTARRAVTTLYRDFLRLAGTLEGAAAADLRATVKAGFASSPGGPAALSEGRRQLNQLKGLLGMARPQGS